MKLMVKYPYFKAAGISLLFHAALLGFLPLFADAIRAPVSSAAPIAVEFVPASVMDTGNTLSGLGSPAAAQGRQVESQSVTQPQQAAKPERQTPRPVAAEAPLPQQIAASPQASSSATAQSSSVGGAAMTEIPGAGGGSVGGHDGQGTGDGSGAGTGGGFGDGAGGGAQAGYISGSRPAYPREALRAGWEGTVVIRVLVGADGLPAATSVRSSSGYGALDDAAAQAIKQWRFTPARRGGNPVDSYFDVRVKFSLADASGL